jgi:hypothetical protein
LTLPSAAIEHPAANGYRHHGATLKIDLRNELFVKAEQCRGRQPACGWGQIRMRSIDWDLVDQEKSSIATANRY